MKTMEKPNTFIMVDNNTVINVKQIRWIKKYKECLYVCTRSQGCSILTAHEICKKKNMEGYMKLNTFFDET